MSFASFLRSQGCGSLRQLVSCASKLTSLTGPAPCPSSSRVFLSTGARFRVRSARYAAGDAQYTRSFSSLIRRTTTTTLPRQNTLLPGRAANSKSKQQTISFRQASTSGSSSSSGKQVQQEAKVAECKEDIGKGHCISQSMLQAFDYTGSVLFAFTGSLKAAVLAQMDVLGCCLVGFTTAVGGGTVRDLLLGSTPVFWMKSPVYILIGALSSLATFFIYPHVRTGKGLKFDENEEWVLNWADAISLGVFATAGAMNATQKKMPPLVVCVCGMMTATFGGVIRDILCQQKPWIFHSDSGLYASTALSGATAFVATSFIAPLPVAIGACISTVVAMRYVSWTYKVALPRFSVDK
eukprot:CAMPEP_0197481296 /NCGR_PEP_ID=MMETSP1309-20131121/46453_1 /TAXON_ID=464262 /ORGANISM="Genus nov. species nov., Strain RCC998" /LENGTH=351 /DNA_ID=CAMNT_0043023497 /DNA_START=155 /DNA_END=1210 /DNA_ORIENTATION=+